MLLWLCLLCLIPAKLVPWFHNSHLGEVAFEAVLTATVQITSGWLSETPSSLPEDNARRMARSGVTAETGRFLGTHL